MTIFSSFRGAIESPSNPLSTPLLDDEDEENKRSGAVSPTDEPHDVLTFSRRAEMYMFASLAVNLILLVAAVYAGVQRSLMVRWEGASQVYTPVLDSITHTRAVFTPLLAKTKWHGPPNDAVDRAWEDLYDTGISAISGAQASLLLNKTTPIAGLEDKYIVSLDVFHQLHCLNTLRKFQHPKRYPYVVQQRYREDKGYGTIDHIDHCIQAIRETLMCHADRTLDPYVKPSDRNRTQVSFESYHTCRDFGAIQQWARDNQSPFKFSDTVLAHGSLVPA
ncbi:hypothetical protein DL93DRAFT_2168257 [Clavulina sp. PMI_390]|nr:hypothetical protein DL93DRAFT_2168257 [Clavulina sp. PMI_390]